MSDFDTKIIKFLRKLAIFIKFFTYFLVGFIDEKQKIFKYRFAKDNMFNWFSRKKGVKELKEETKRSFESVKKDITSINNLIKYLDSEKNIQKKGLEDLREILSSIKEEFEEIKNIISISGGLKINKMFKTPKQLFNKQTAVYAVQTGVQTGVQTPNLDQFSITERAILWVLLNSDMKLSYNDLAAILGKERSTIRGQINAIKQKSNGLIEESIEKNGKKRMYIQENAKEKMLKKSKVRVNNYKRIKKS